MTGIGKKWSDRRGWKAPLGPAFLCLLAAFLAPIPAARALGGRGGGGGGGGEDVFVAIQGARILTISGEEIDRGTIVIRNGKIEAVGKNVEVPWGAERIDAAGLVVMPGLVHPWTRYHLPSYRRSGIHTDLTGAAELFPARGAFEDLLEAGFTTVGIYPPGSGLPGRASAIHPLDGSAAEIVVERAATIRIPFSQPSRDKKALRDALRKAKAAIDKVEKARKAWEEKQKKKAEEAAKKKKQGKEPPKKEPPKKEPPKKEPPKKEPPGGVTPQKGPPKKEGGAKTATKKEPEKFQPPKIDPKLQPLVDLLQKKAGVRALVELDQAAGYVHFQDVLKEFEIEHAYQVHNPRRSFVNEWGGRNDTDAGLIAETMGKEKPGLLLYPEINNLPFTTERVNLPLRFLRAGCSISFAPATDSRDAFLRYREKVAEVVKYGLPRDEALEAITLHPARLLGLGERIGTIEKDRDADLIFLDGDPLEQGSRVVKVMIGGRIVAEPASKP